ncbi:MAG: RIP metalloprotease RseP [Bacteroidales bacterium]|nr:RIP metalloprotease RseP [Bacteroidales bacterium]
MVVLIKALQVILALSLLVVIHEFGHFLFARIFGIRVDKFFLFFDAGGVKLLSTKEGWFSRLFPKLKAKQTEYGIGWLPIGGYCKINGMVDESMDTDFIGTEPNPDEFRSHPAWQRFLVMFGGVFFNFILAILIYALIMGVWGKSYISNEGNAIYVNDLAYEMGFRSGDHILAFDDYVPENFATLQADLARRDVTKATVLRGTDTLDIYIDHAMLGQVLNSPDMFSLAVPFVVDSVMAGSPNMSAGIVSGDRIIAIDTVKVEFVQDAREILASHAGGEVEALMLRAADTLRVPLQVDSLGRIGVYMVFPGLQVKKYTALSAIPAGCEMAFETIGGYLRDLRLVASPSTQAYKSVGSFIAIGQVFPSAWDWYAFLQILALLSIMLGVMNLLPIPGLDGGHIVFILFEILTGRKPSDRFLMVMQMIGMFILLMLMFLAFGNDITRLLR